MISPGSGCGKATGAGSLHQFVEIRVLRLHFGAFDGVDYDGGRIRRAVASPGRGNEPVIMIGREQHELPPTVSGYFYRLTQCPMLELAELALKLDRRRL